MGYLDTSGVTKLWGNFKSLLNNHTSNMVNHLSGADRVNFNSLTTMGYVGTIYVDYTNGSDANNGDTTHPYKTLEKAWSRIPFKSSGNDNATIVIRGNYPTSLNLDEKQYSKITIQAETVGSTLGFGGQIALVGNIELIGFTVPSMLRFIGNFSRIINNCTFNIPDHGIALLFSGGYALVEKCKITNTNGYFILASNDSIVQTNANNTGTTGTAVFATDTATIYYYKSVGSTSADTLMCTNTETMATGFAKIIQATDKPYMTQDDGLWIPTWVVSRRPTSGDTIEIVSQTPLASGRQLNSNRYTKSGKQILLDYYIDLSRIPAKSEEAGYTYSYGINGLPYSNCGRTGGYYGVRPHKRYYDIDNTIKNVYNAMGTGSTYVSTIEFDIYDFVSNDKFDRVFTFVIKDSTGTESTVTKTFSDMHLLGHTLETFLIGSVVYATE